MKSLFLCLFVLLAVPVMAQTLQPEPVSVASSGGVYFPGSLWSSTGLLTPAEPRNIISMNHLEQGIGYMGFSVFGELEGTLASQPNDWEHRALIGAGVRFTQTLGDLGMIRFSFAEAEEHRYLSGDTYRGPQVNVELWLGWSQKGKK